MIWNNRPPSTTDAFRAASLLWGISKSELLRESRNARLVNQRWIVFGLLSGRGFTNDQIAEVFNMHPSTVAYGLKQHLEARDEEYLENSEALIDLHNQLLHGHDPCPKTSEDSYRYFPNSQLGRQNCPNMGGFSDYNKETQLFK